MFLLDDLLLYPIKGVVSLCKKVDEAAHQDIENQEKNIVASLGELHRRLEMGQIDEATFDIEESTLLEKMDNLAGTLQHDGDQNED
jgi:hypothetical protein